MNDYPHILHLPLIHLLTISAVVVSDIPLNLIRNKVIKYDKGKELFIIAHLPLIDPKNGQGELTTSKALIFGLISEVHRIISLTHHPDIHY